MAATIVTKQTYDEGGATLTEAACDSSNGNKWLNTGNEYVSVRNSHASSSLTVTIAPANANLDVPGVGDMTIASSTATLAAGAVAHFGPFPPPAWNDSSGYCTVTFGGTAPASATIAVMAPDHLKANN